MSRTGIAQPPTRGFMDDITITCKTVVEARWTLEELGEMITWARMKFKFLVIISHFPNIP